MGRMSDQAKLLFFGLLRTVSALASTEHKVVPFCAESLRHHQSLVPELTLRLAHRTDVSGIQRCNLATLPENYNQHFYTNHLRQWPELAIVVECTSEDKAPQEQEQQQRQGESSASFVLKPDGHYSYSPFPHIKPSGNIVAYVIGKVESQPVHVDDSRLDEDDWRSSPGFLSTPTFRTERLGHVTSLAVLEPYRRRGLAQALMEQLHHHMAAYYGVEWVGLHVRQSNAPAEKLYQAFGYDATERITGYYQDGEDAYLMKKRLQEKNTYNSKNHHNNNNNLSLFGNLRRPKPSRQNIPDELRLPRVVGRPPISPVNQEDESSSSSSPTSQLLTGTMY